MDWYEHFIEPEVRELVRILRNNGVNTTCSCGHEMYIEAQWLGEALYDVYRLVYDWAAERRDTPDFTMVASVQVKDGVPYWLLRFDINTAPCHGGQASQARR